MDRKKLFASMLLLATLAASTSSLQAAHIGGRLASHATSKTKTIATARASQTSKATRVATKSKPKGIARATGAPSKPKGTARATARTSHKKRAASVASRTKKTKQHNRMSVASRKRASAKIAASRSKKATGKIAGKVNSSQYMWSAAWFDKTPYGAQVSRTIHSAFQAGDAGHFTPRQMVKAGVFQHYPLSGGIFNRKERVKHIILHSTETARAADAKRVIRSWNNRGLRHPGAQYVVDRDGTIYQTVDPAYATVHVNINRTRLGVNNDNSVGIEMVRTGKQKYTRSQMDSVVRLVSYLQDKYDIAGSMVLAHGYVQPSDRTDPVGFDWHKFNSDLAFLKVNQTTAFKLKPGSRG